MRPPTLYVFVSLLSLVHCLRCKNCRKTAADRVVCDSDCSGDVCVLWTDKEEKTQMQGCLTGIPPEVAMGCRRNHVDATLCLCNDFDLCNDQTALQSNTIKILPKLSCSSFIDAPYLPKENGNTCEGSFCFYHKNVVTNFASRKETQVMADCSQLPQFTFDLQVATIWPGPGAVSGACYLLQAHGSDTTLGCMCENDQCNKEQPFALPEGKVMCHQAYNILDDNSISNETCQGQYCLIQKAIDPARNEARYMKGCITVSKEGIITNGYRNILGVEQWFCDWDKCNLNVESAALRRRQKNLTRPTGGAGSCNIPRILMMLYLLPRLLQYY